MKPTSSKSLQIGLWESAEPISSPESEAGTSRSSLPDGLKTGPSGPEAVPASHSASQAKDSEKPTSDTSGLHGESSSESASLTSFLENRLRQRLAVNGSPEYELTWKKWDMQWGGAIFALRASARRTSGSDSTGWRSPDSSQRGGAYQNPELAQRRAAAGHQINLEDQAVMAGWPSPKTPTGGPNSQREHRGAGGPDLQEAPLLAHGWATPRAEDSEQTGAHRGATDTLTSQARTVAGWARPSCRDYKDTPGMSTTGTNPDGSERNRIDQLPRQAAQAGWTSPRATDGKAGHDYTENTTGRSLTADASLTQAGWPSPLATEVRQGYQNRHNGKKGTQESLSTVAIHAVHGTPEGWPTPNTMTGGQTSRGGDRKDEKLMSGLVQPSSPARTESRGALSPVLPLWLMGFPIQWLQAALPVSEQIKLKKRRRQ